MTFAVVALVAVSILLSFLFYLAWSTRRDAVYNYHQSRAHRDSLVQQLHGAQARIHSLEQQLQQAKGGTPQAKVPPSQPKYGAQAKAVHRPTQAPGPAQHATYSSDQPLIVPIVHSHHVDCDSSSSYDSGCSSSYDGGGGCGGGFDSGGGGGFDGGGGCGGCGGF